MCVDRYRSDPYDYPDPYPVRSMKPLDPPNSEPTIERCPTCGNSLHGDRWRYGSGPFVHAQPAFIPHEQERVLNIDKNCDCDICAGARADKET